MAIDMHAFCLFAIGTLSCLLSVGASMRHYPRRSLRRAIRLAALATGVPGYRAALPRLREAIDRARRHARPLAIVSIETSPDDSGESAAGEARVLAIALTGAIVRDAVRSEDLLAFDAAGGRYLLLLPESSTAESRVVIRRLEALTLARAGLRLTAGTAEFPKDGVTIEDLYHGCVAAAGRERLALSA